ncbi:MAG: type II toxin-antitoxin system VapC family toxin [Actinomycetota bacterium]
MKLLDTNVFIYARGRAGPYKASCSAVLTVSVEQPGLYAIDVELLQELLDVYTRRGKRALAADAVVEALQMFADPFPITRRESEEAADIIRSYRRLTPRDAIHAAVVINYELEGIVSADRSFDQIAGVTRFDPGDFDGA